MRATQVGCRCWLDVGAFAIIGEDQLPGCGSTANGIAADFFLSSGCQLILSEPAESVASSGYSGMKWTDLALNHQARRKGVGKK